MMSSMLTPGVGKQPVGRLLVLPVGKHDGNRLAGPGLPGPGHGQDPVAHPAVGVAAQAELQIRPVGVLRDRRGRAQPVTTTYLTGSFPSPLRPGPYGPGMGFRDVEDAQALP